jgi:ATP dependent DNA ligase domain
VREAPLPVSITPHSANATSAVTKLHRAWRPSALHLRAPCEPTIAPAAFDAEAEPDSVTSWPRARFHHVRLLARFSTRRLHAGPAPPNLPTKTTQLPSGSQWLHEIKHDGFRIIARKSNGRVRLYSRPGNDFTRRFPLIVEALERLRSRLCIVDGEASISNRSRNRSHSRSS